MTEDQLLRQRESRQRWVENMTEEQKEKQREYMRKYNEKRRLKRLQNKQAKKGE
jgi:hypothetical protein